MLSSKRNAKKKITLASTSFSGGGAEKVMVILANNFANRDIEVDFVVAKDLGPHRKNLSKNVNKIVLSGNTSIALVNRLIGFFRLLTYFRNNNPASFMSTLREFNVFCLVAHFVSRSKCKIIVREAETLDPLINKKKLKPKILLFLMKVFYKKSNYVVANSEATKKDLIDHLSLNKKNVKRIYNPVILPEQKKLKKEDFILGCGRLHESKNFADLILAFANVKNKYPDFKLIILGEGPERENLSSLISELGLSDSVILPGFVDTPYSYFLKAKLFVHTSKWEGFGYVLAEAMACGTSVVAYDSKGAINEVLGQGEYGRLVENGNVKALSDSICECLVSPYLSDTLKVGAERFNVDLICDSYLDIMD
ncbi:glycosyltransferase [Idiomarina abyssalis]|uniref:glycosyltransferase n=1 Tax=Idiomarina abyssalis TaxID=86102 RepID=UPI003A913C96